MPQIPSKGYPGVTYLSGYDLSGWLNKITLPAGATKLDTTTYGNGGWETSSPDLAGGSPAFDGLHSGDVNDARTIFAAAFAQEQVSALVGLAGSAIGSPCDIFAMQELKYEIKSGYADLVRVSSGGQYYGAHAHNGFFFHPNQNEVASGTQGGTGWIDNGAASANGYIIGAQVLALSGNDGSHGVEPIIEQSSDHISWSTLYTFGRLVVVGAPVLGISFALTSIPRYLRARWILDTGVHATFVLAAARR
jgi:hypothetical protein